MNLLSPDGFTVPIQSLSSNYYRTIGAPARTSSTYEMQQRYNIAMLGNIENVSSGEKIVKIGPHGLRLNSLVKGSN